MKIAQPESNFILPLSNSVSFHIFHNGKTELRQYEGQYFYTFTNLKDFAEKGLDFLAFATTSKTLPFTNQQFSFQMVADKNGDIQVYFFDTFEPSVKSIVPFTTILEMLRKESLTQQYCSLILPPEGKQSEDEIFHNK